MIQPGVSETWVMCGQKCVYNNVTYYVTNLNLHKDAFYRAHMLAYENNFIKHIKS